ncbi:MAG: hypothetical protein P8N43_14010 [Alphaproteobacteria bacterium]|nr:hypothetical protein [Alphaproteobacteria bacterium]
MDPQPEPSNTLDSSADDDMDEWEREIMSQNALDQSGDKKEPLKPENVADARDNDPDDDEIAFID